jgi:hypothetical protein
VHDQRTQRSIRDFGNRGGGDYQQLNAQCDTLLIAHRLHSHTIGFVKPDPGSTPSPDTLLPGSKEPTS